MMTTPTSSPLLCLTPLSTLSDAERQCLQHFLPVLPVEAVYAESTDLNNQSDQNPEPTTPDGKQIVPIVKVVDGRGLACPLPLLKTKVALREVAVGQGLYVVATDPNSRADIAAFCRQHGGTESVGQSSPTLALVLQCTSQSPSSKTDTFFHFIITKTDSN